MIISDKYKAFYLNIQFGDFGVRLNTHRNNYLYITSLYKNCLETRIIYKVQMRLTRNFYV